MDERTTSRVTGTVATAVAALGVFWLIPSYTGDARTANDLSPALVPTIALSVCGLLGIALALRRPRESDPLAAPPGIAPEPIVSGPALLGDLALWSAASVATLALLSHAGFLVAAPLAIAGWMAWCGERSPFRIAAFALTVPIVLERLSWYALTVPLP